MAPGLFALDAELAIDQDASTPGIGGCIANRSRHREVLCERNFARLERKFRLVDGNRVLARQIAPAIVEKQLSSDVLQDAGDDGLRLTGEPNPNVSLLVVVLRSHRG